MAHEQLEREIKLTITAKSELPDFADYGQVVDNGIANLETTYWDSHGAQLAANSWGLRHRTDDTDIGIWTLKGPSHTENQAVVRPEYEVKASGDTPPRELIEYLPESLKHLVLTPIVCLQVDRHSLFITTKNRRCEVVDDQVLVLSLQGTIIDEFREIEIEFEQGADQLAEWIAGKVKTECNVIPGIGSKYARALQALQRNSNNLA